MTENNLAPHPSLDEANDWTLKPTFALASLLQKPLPIEAKSDATLHPSLEEANDWTLKPTFASASLLQKPLPIEANETDATLWAKMKFQGSLRFVTQKNLESVSQESAMARERHCSLSPLYNRFPKHLPFVLLMAEIHFLLNDTHGALDLLREALVLHFSSNEEQDETLIRAVAVLDVVAAEAEQAYGPDAPDVEVFVYSRPPNWCSCRKEPSEFEAIQERWGALKKEGNGAKEFACFAAVKSNELEGVFLLDGTSGEQLSRCGLYANCIQGISRKSRLQNPNQIISILKNAQKVYTNLEGAAQGKIQFGQAFLKQQHAQLLEGNNISVEFDDYSETLVCSLVPMGKFRRVPCVAQHHRDNAETQFCLPGHMECELKWFFEQADTVLNDSSADPYRACAWLQHAFLKIHPFGDGNGRVGRMISSIPLLKAGLPPVFVSVENKFEYFDALIAADDNQDIDMLASFLQRETFHALDKLLRYIPSPTRSVTPRRRRGCSRRRDWAMRLVASKSHSPLAGDEQRTDTNTCERESPGK